MAKRVQPLILVALAGTVLAIGAHAASRWASADAPLAASPASPTAIVATANTGTAPVSKAALAARPVAGEQTLGAKRAPTQLEVGDVDSFGRNLKWLGVQQMAVELASTCGPVVDPAYPCVHLDPVNPTTAFNLQDVQRFVIPGDSAESLFCHWFSPVLSVAYLNPTDFPVKGWLDYTPTLTIENPVLNDPSLVDPNTGLPYNGRITVGMTGSEREEVLLGARQDLFSRTRDTATCVAGFVSKRQLVEVYGLSPAQARKFFRKPTTVRMNIRGNARFVADAYLIFGLRIVGD